MKKSIVNFELTEQQLQKEIKRVEYVRRRRTAFKRTIVLLLVIAAVTVLSAALWFPVFRITGNTMAPQLEDGQVVLAYRTQRLEKGDIVAFYQENKVRIQSVIAKSGDWIDIDEQGAVLVNNQKIDEIFIDISVLDGSTLTYPYQVPEDCCFVVSDQGESSIDLRTFEGGCIRTDQIVGKILVRIWPLNRFEYLG